MGDGPNGGGFIPPETLLVIAAAGVAVSASVVVANAIYGTLSLGAPIALAGFLILMVIAAGLSPTSTAPRRRQLATTRTEGPAPTGMEPDPDAEPMTRRELVSLTQMAVVLKIAAVFLHIYWIDNFQNKVADLYIYHDFGLQYAEMASSGGIERIEYAGRGTDNFINTMGWFYVFLGTNIYVQSILMGLFAVTGYALTAKAARMVLPVGRHRVVTKLLLFAPSLVFWTAAIGKDAMLSTAIGGFLLGTAIATDGKNPGKGMTIATLCLLFISAIRPHVSVALVGAVLAGLVLHRAPESEIRGKNVKPAVMVAGLFALVFVASQLESVAGISLNVGELNEAAQDTQGTREESGGTLLAFAGAVTNPLQIPIAIVTTLFRPLIFDAYLGPQILGQSIEGTALFTIALLNLRRRAEWVARIRASETLSIAFFYLLFCSIGFAAINNAGTLARQRAQWLPALIVLLCVVKWTKPTPQELRAPIDLGAEEPAGSATKANLRRPASLW